LLRDCHHCWQFPLYECALVAEGPSIEIFESETEIIFVYAPMNFTLVLDKKNEEIFKKIKNTP
jgi:hypothetical protein